MRHIRRGRTGALEQIYDRHSSAAFSLAYAILRDRGLAEEATQDAFLAIWRKAGDYRPERGSLRSWLLTIVRNRCFDALRRKVRDPSYEPMDERRWSCADGDVTAAEVIRCDEADGVRSGLAKLPAEQRRVIALAYFGGFTQAEIARRLELPLGTVKSRLRLGLGTLREGVVRQVAQRTEDLSA